MVLSGAGEPSSVALNLEAPMHHVFPTNQQLASIFFVVLPLKLLISPVETIREIRGRV